jgi:hypothetical protein
MYLQVGNSAQRVSQAFRLGYRLLAHKCVFSREAYVLRGFESTVPSSVTIPTPTLFAEPSIPKTFVMGTCKLSFWIQTRWKHLRALFTNESDGPKYHKCSNEDRIARRIYVCSMSASAACLWPCVSTWATEKAPPALPSFEGTSFGAASNLRNPKDMF